MKGLAMPSQKVVVASTVGLHARPAKLLATAAGAAGLPVTIAKADGAPVNAASLLMVMALGAKCGEEVEISVGEGDNADEVLAALVEIVATNHDE
jgi:phosphocarrier protein